MGKTEPTPNTVDLSQINLARSGHNFLMGKKQGEYTVDELNTLNEYLLHVLKPENHPTKKFKVGLMFICINAPYWQYIENVIQDAKNLFLPGHDVDYFLWSDIPDEGSNKEKEVLSVYGDEITETVPMTLEQAKESLKRLQNIEGVTYFPVDSVEWPLPTLMRYTVMLGQEEKLKDYDYLFYLDADMRIVNVVGDEILGEGITAAQHPMYALDRKFIPPYEPNPGSHSFIPRPGRTGVRDGKAFFEPLYFAGGFQGGKADVFLEAMKGTKRIIDADMVNNYIPIWNDESAWNKYLFENPPAIVLSPSYIYPDSLIEEYYVKVWGKRYTPRIVTLTKPFSISKEAGVETAKHLDQLSGL